MLGILKIQKLSIIQKLLLFGLILFGVTMLSSGRAQAATLNVATGTDENTTNSSCSLSEAIENINDQAQTNTDCPAGDGSDDTINIPAGTITLIADLATITESVNITGAGIDQTIINGDSGQFTVFRVDGQVDFSASGMTITAFENYGINAAAENMDVSYIEIDGTSSLPGTGEINGLILIGYNIIDSTIEVNNIYVHDLVGSATIIQGLGIGNRAQGSHTNINIANATVSNLTNNSSDGSINTFLFSIGAFGLNGGGGSIDATVSNVTITDVVANGANGSASGFGGFGLASSGNTDIEVTAQNVTVTGIRGNTSAYGATTPLFAAGAGFTGSDVATTTLNVVNSLFADNLSNGSSKNCDSLDVTSVFGGSGSAVVSINSLGHNIADDATCTSFTEEGDRQNVTNIITTLDILKDNGGYVPTRALLPGSPAIGTGGVVLGITTDARGVPRDPSKWDVGAYQSVLGDSTTSTSEDSGSSNGGVEELADTGQNLGISPVLGILLISGSLILIIHRLKFT